ncbi:MAG: HAMP domain-containing protein, partial [Bryobacter sp.]|nr:HAMP domain-containing protein [Bryobacter sp.]
MRWTKAIRVQLTAWYSLALVGILLIFSLGIDWFFARHLRSRLDHDLESVLDVIALSLNHEMEEHGSLEAGVDAFRTVLATMHRTSFPHHGIAVYDGPRLIGGKAGDNVPLPAVGVPAPEGVRTAARLVRVDIVQRAFLVTANQSTRELEEELQGFRGILFAGIPLMLLPAVAGGWILASRSLAPVMDMAARVEKISSENLHERLPPAPADDELGRLTGTFNRLLERLEGAFEQQRRFMADASHELRTPVSIALTSAQTTLEQPTRAEYAYRDALTTIERQMTRLSRIVRDLFLMARADGGRLEIEQRP